MKFIKISLVVSSLLLSTLAKADAGVFFGFTYAFGGGGPAVSLKVLSSDKVNEGVVGAGVSFYPYSANKFGADVSAGYNFTDSGVTIGYDFLQKGVQLGVGYVNTRNDSPAPAPVAAPAPAPVPPTGPRG